MSIFDWFQLVLPEYFLHFLFSFLFLCAFQFGSLLWNLPLVIYHIRRWVTADGCLLCACKGELHLQSWVPTSGTCPWLSGTFTGELLLMAVCCMHAKVSYAYRAGFPLVKPPLGCLVHSHVSYCCWLSAVCVFVCVCVCVCVLVRVCVCVQRRVMAGFTIICGTSCWLCTRWVSGESCLLCACEVELQSLVRTCGTSTWLSTAFTDELLLVAVGCVCLSEGDVCVCVCVQRWGWFHNDLWNLLLDVYQIHRWVTADGCLLFACKVELQSLVHTCGTFPWSSSIFTGELLLMAVCSVYVQRWVMAGFTIICGTSCWLSTIFCADWGLSGLYNVYMFNHLCPIMLALLCVYVQLFLHH